MGYVDRDARGYTFVRREHLRFWAPVMVGLSAEIWGNPEGLQWHFERPYANGAVRGAARRLDRKEKR